MNYDNNDDSTMSNIVIKITDEPNVSSGTNLTYRLKVYGQSNGDNFSLNRTINSSDSAHYYERSSSYVELEERF